MTDVREQVRSRYSAGLASIQHITETKSTEALSLFRIGKPSRFTPEVDDKRRISEYIESKMNVIDLIPCDFSLPLTKLLENLSKDNKNVFVDTIRPNIIYEDAISEFKIISSRHGLPSRYGGIRMFLTDDTTATDEFSNTYQDNWLGSKFNSMANIGTQLRSFGRSTSSKYGDMITGLTNLGVAKGKENINQLTEDQLLQKGLASTLSGVGTAAKAVLLGNKLSLPKAWSDASYTPNFNAVVKLVSPYGHPDAIKEFIIKPLMYLLIMGSPRTDDGITYRQSPLLTVKGYGITYLPLASISSISLRKGGADTSFNIFRQPLSVDVSLTFQSLLPGFAIHTDERGAMDGLNRTAFSTASEINTSLRTAEGNTTTFFPTLGSIIESIKPVAINNIAKRYVTDSGLPRKTAVKEDSGIKVAQVEEYNVPYNLNMVQERESVLPSKRVEDYRAAIDAATSSHGSDTSKGQADASKGKTGQGVEGEDRERQLLALVTERK